ncbi:MAG: DUF488 family protein [Halofilum sp. (in: g-proteobacteria)]|nr:DUF488 family protein [Halofilum sp. (in: g-proteobacteria)]
MAFQLKRVRDPVEPDDGHRVLVDGMWPRGVRKQEAAVDEWLREIAPSRTLRQWFGHDPARWEEFVRRYHAELDAMPECVERLAELGRDQTVTLCHDARDRKHNNAVALKAYLDHS